MARERKFTPSPGILVDQSRLDGGTGGERDGREDVET